MAAQEYLQSLLDAQEVPEADLRAMREIRDRIEQRLAKLGGSPRFYYAGSYGKRTMIRERYDLDIVIYWSKDVDYTLKDIYDAVGQELRKEYHYLNTKTVCWEVPFQSGFHVDVVPGRALDFAYKEANLYKSDTQTTLKTSIKTHIDTVRGSNRRDAIRLLKLWRERKKVPFKKSFLLEMMTINGCSGCSTSDLQAQVLAALRYISDKIETVQIMDPANSNNSLSDDIPNQDKGRIKLFAEAAINAQYWTDVFSKA